MKKERKIYSIDEIREKVSSVLKNYAVKSCLLFGSYARGEATSRSDVDLVIDTEVTGFAYYGLWLKIEEKLGKKVDFLRNQQVNASKSLHENVEREGKLIYGHIQERQGALQTYTR